MLLSFSLKFAEFHRLLGKPLSDEFSRVRLLIQEHLLVWEGLCKWPYQSSLSRFRRGEGSEGVRASFISLTHVHLSLSDEVSEERDAECVWVNCMCVYACGRARVQLRPRDSASLIGLALAGGCDGKVRTSVCMRICVYSRLQHLSFVNSITKILLTILQPFSATFLHVLFF